ncbi:MAG TPA: hypothetical protein VFM27_19880 [Acidimicrobiales bacterium]|nr:hypothetical protein [Acidimicrobiales bacterium]
MRGADPAAGVSTQLTAASATGTAQRSLIITTTPSPPDTMLGTRRRAKMAAA